ncbi:dihydrofolate reductase family protein [Actinospica sp.]|jgi:dihydrofolate reductase|uniref:dihydrofolate reductase family protein n=1 Tax=Actinospica sp. TaxID=1872142 RepID=UPI002B7A9D55|nr:dihydrofolate reductase family protein [Actinospica sp.]HWG26773.1 dihydrofolate reductase family protein [Actinospica sp.]
MTGQVIVDITMSLDGYVTAPGADVDHGLGVNGEPLHAWVFSGAPEDGEILDDMTARTGAVIMGRRLFDVVDAPHGWNESIGYGADRNAPPPVFVLTHQAPQTWRLGDRFTFVTDGLRSALDQARAAAGEKDVVVMGGGAVCYEFLAADLADILNIHLSPIVLGGGTRLFPAHDAKRLRLEQIDIVSTPSAHHLSYRVIT